jgi:hypothetical protein
MKGFFGLLGLYFGTLLYFWTFCLALAFDYWEEAFTLGLLVWEAFGREKN